MLYHIIKRTHWQAAEINGEYRPPSLFDEGYIHLSNFNQVVDVAERFYKDVSDLLLLEIDRKRLDATLRFDKTPDGIYPHLYGPLNIDAVTAVYPFDADAAGAFTMPPPAVAKRAQSGD